MGQGTNKYAEVIPKPNAIFMNRMCKTIFTTFGSRDSVCNET